MVHLRVRGRLDDEGLAGLRQQLATCLASGVTDIRVHLGPGTDADLMALHTLRGAAEHLAREGGSLVVHGASPAVVTRMRTYGFEHLLPDGADAGLPVADVEQHLS
jgi:anti-anti-sigma regulatory factor